MDVLGAKGTRSMDASRSKGLGAWTLLGAKGTRSVDATRSKGH